MVISPFPRFPSSLCFDMPTMCSNVFPSVSWQFLCSCVTRFCECFALSPPSMCHQHSWALATWRHHGTHHSVQLQIFCSKWHKSSFQEQTPTSKARNRLVNIFQSFRYGGILAISLEVYKNSALKKAICFELWCMKIAKWTYFGVFWFCTSSTTEMLL